MSTQTPKADNPRKQVANPKAKPSTPDRDEAAEKTEGNEGLPGKVRDPESDGMEFPDGTGRKHSGDLGTGN